MTDERGFQAYFLQIILPLFKKRQGQQCRGGRDDMDVAPAVSRFTTVLPPSLYELQLGVTALSGAHEPKVLARSGGMRCNDQGHRTGFSAALQTNTWGLQIAGNCF